MKLKHITFAGLDETVNLRKLVALQKRFPIAEFGVSTSFYKPNFPNPSYDTIFPDYRFIERLARKGLNLNLQVWGKATECILMGDWSILDYFTNYNLDSFQRVQLNIAHRTSILDVPARIPNEKLELIIQQESVVECAKFAQIKELCQDGNRVTMMIDDSIHIGHTFTCEVAKNLPKVGYTGAIDSTNILFVLVNLLQFKQDTEFWIEITDGVRSNDWFDLNKVEEILVKCQPVIDYLN